MSILRLSWQIRAVKDEKDEKDEGMEFAAELKRIAEGIPYQKANARNEQQTIEGASFDHLS